MAYLQVLYDSLILTVQSPTFYLLGIFILTLAAGDRVEEEPPQDR